MLMWMSEEIPADLACSLHDKADIELVKVNCEADELWSFVGWNQAAGADQQAVALAGPGSS